MGIQTFSDMTNEVAPMGVKAMVLRNIYGQICIHRTFGTQCRHHSRRRVSEQLWLVNRRCTCIFSQLLFEDQQLCLFPDPVFSPVRTGCPELKPA